MDSEGNDIGYKRSMDKAMKALKDRRHIKTRKLVGSRPTSQSGQAIKKDANKRQELKKRVEGLPISAKKIIPKAPKPKDPLSTDDAGHALLLLRKAADEVVLEESSHEESPRLPLNKRKYIPEQGARRLPLASALKKPREPGSDELKRYRERSDDYFEEPRRRFSGRSQSSHSEQGTASTRSTSPPTQPPSPHVQGLDKAHILESDMDPSTDKPKEGNARMPVLWQSVIVSRESPQASLADMLVNAKQRLEALSSIQQAVSAPICLIYPPNHGIGLQTASHLQSFPGQVAFGQMQLGSQVQLARFPLRQEVFQGTTRSSVL